MIMTIATVHEYQVLIPDQRIYDESGDELEGHALESRRVILISPAVPPERREEVLGHEVAHAWAFHVGEPNTEEGRCQLGATILQQVRTELEAQGGVAALMELPKTSFALPHPAPPQRKRANAPALGVDRWECGCCAAPMLCGSIENGDAVFHEGVAQFQILRWFRCEICGTLNIWHEVATSDGQPTGLLVQVPRPRLLSGRAAAEWLAENAVTAGR